MGANILALPFTKAVSDIMFDAKSAELLKLAEKYNTPVEELKTTLHAELTASKMRTGACNTALDFLIVEAVDKNKVHKSVKVGIRENILASAIYYANVIGHSEYV